MDLLVHTRDKGTIETMDFTRWTCSEKAKTVPSATVFWDSQDVIYIDYLEKGKTVTGLCYAELLGRFDAELQKKRPHLAKKKMLFHRNNHATGSHLRCRHGQIGRIRLQSAASSTVFSRFGRVRLPFVYNLEKVTRRAKIWFKWGGYRRNGGLLCTPPENVFFRQVKEVETSLRQVYRAKKTLCWEISRHFSKIFVLFFVD